LFCRTPHFSAVKKYIGQPRPRLVNAFRMSSIPETLNTIWRPWTSPGSSAETYEGHCHCGAVRFTCTLSPPPFPTKQVPTEQWKVVECNCSICTRNGSLLVHPYARDVTCTRGLDKLTEYRFGSMIAAHLFCQCCGSTVAVDLSAFGDLEGGERCCLMYVDRAAEAMLLINAPATTPIRCACLRGWI